MPQNEAIANDLSEELAECIPDERLIKDVLGLSGVDAYERYKDGVKNGLWKFGGSFGQALGNLLLCADFKNSIRILNVWQKECVEHEMLWRIYEAKEKAKNEPLYEAKEKAKNEPL